MLQILEYVVRRGFKVELLSNGLIFNDFLADRIAAIGLNQITFSFDGTDAQTHDTFRGVPGGYAKTVAAVSALDNYRTIHRTDFTILLKTVVNRTNVTQLSKNAEWARKHGAEILFQPIEQNYDADTGDNWYKTSPHWITDLPVLENEVQKLISLSVPQGPVCNTKDSLLKMVEYFKKPDELMHMIQDHDINTPKEYCRHAVYRFDVSSSGDVRMCFRMEPCGNIKNQSPKQIWENRKICWAQPCDFR
jgi:MoaA/NifB/PqqE/SkfB family radical SAM enzyme